MRELRVRLSFSPDDVRDVGILAQDGRAIWFEFDSAFVDSGVEISPLRLPIAHGGLIEHRPRPGAPIPGVFNDARPDGWGLKLLHRAFQSKGRVASSVSPLDELAFLGPNTMGALVFEPTTGPTDELDDAIELAALAAHAQAVWDDRVQDVLPALVRAGGPSGGARPKALVGLRADGQPGVRFGEGALPDGWVGWLVKFPTSTDDVDVGRREQAWMAMARDAGIDVPDSQILHLDGIGDAFAVRRFDRLEGAHRRHMLSAAGALDADFRTAAADYEHLLQATQQICAGDQSQVIAMFRLAAFNVASVNQDDHLKNFAWLLNAEGDWRLAPGFDLTYAPSLHGERWTTVAGAGAGIGRGHLLEVAAKVGIKAAMARQVLDQVAQAAMNVEQYLAERCCEAPVSRTAVESVREAASRVAG